MNSLARTAKLDTHSYLKSRMKFILLSRSEDKTQGHRPNKITI